MITLEAVPLGKSLTNLRTTEVLPCDVKVGRAGTLWRIQRCMFIHSCLWYQCSCIAGNLVHLSYREGYRAWK